MEYYFLDKVNWQHSQALYHAAAHLGREALFILRPETPYVCIGFHQDAEQEIDLDFARDNSIPVFRREVGGGAVYLDGGQLFYQFILRSDHPKVTLNKSELYRRFLEPIVETYRAFGVQAEYKPVNDIIANGRKVSGNGAGEIEDMIVIVGNFILDFDYEMMSKVLRVPDEKFRDKVYKTLQDNLSTFKREAGHVPETEALADDLVKRLEPLLGKLTKRTTLDDELLDKATDLIKVMDTPSWLLENDRRRMDTRDVKIREGVNVVRKMVKTPGGLLRITAINEDGVLHNVHISGDFFIYPQDKLVDLEAALEGVQAEQAEILKMINGFYNKHMVQTPGLQPDDIARLLTMES